MNDVVFFDESTATDEGRAPPWVVAIIDDDKSVHDSTRLALHGLEFEGRGFHFLSAYSAVEGRVLLENTPDIACVLLDVVMENSQAGLDLADEIRGRMRNRAIRIILRTGQPGYAPPMEVLAHSDINDYREKTELTRSRLWASVVCALRGYRHIRALERNQEGLEMMIRSSSRLMQRRPVEELAQEVVTCLAAHLGVEPEGLVCVQHKSERRAATIVGGAGQYAELTGQRLDALRDDDLRASIGEVLKRKVDVIGDDSTAFSIDTPDWSGVIYLRGRIEPDDEQKRILSLFCRNVSLSFENIRLFDVIAGIAFTDSVTGLSSRARLDETVRPLVEAGKRPLALVIDIDHFHFYNQYFGRAFGDAILAGFADRLRGLCPNASRIGRLYGDIFCLILPEQEFSSEVIARLSGPLLINGNPMRLGFTFGQARYTHEHDDAGGAGELIQKAEIALKVAKARCRGTVVQFSDDLERAEQDRVALANELREALVEERGISLVYQPQVDCRSNRIRSVEALMRWNSPQRGIVPPSLFIPAAEATGLIVELGFLALRRACREMKPFLDKGWINHIAVNVSALQLREPGLLTNFGQIIREEGLDESQIEIEITESAALTEENTIALFTEARNKGHKIALDDFGTGYSSLSILRWLPLDLVKIDQSFLPRDTGSRNSSRSIIPLITEICRQLGFESILEGVETPAQLAMAQEAGTDFVQGYLIARPLPPDQLAVWLRERG